MGEALDSTGPYLAMAVLCEKVLQEADGTSSIIRVVDRITVQPQLQPPPIMAVQPQVPSVPESMPALPINVTLALMFKSGTAKGRSTLTVRPETPAGLALPELKLPAFFEGEDRGINIFLNLSFLAETEGLYWIGIYLDDNFVTRVPLRMVYQPIQTGSGPPVR